MMKMGMMMLAMGISKQKGEFDYDNKKRQIMIRPLVKLFVVFCCCGLHSGGAARYLHTATPI